jgi:hypothetical protein
MDYNLVVLAAIFIVISLMLARFAINLASLFFIFGVMLLLIGLNHEAIFDANKNAGESTEDPEAMNAEHVNLKRTRPQRPPLIYDWDTHMVKTTNSKTKVNTPL